MAPQLWQEKIESIFQADRFDRLDFNEATKAYPRLLNSNTRWHNEYCGQPIQDAFLDLYKAAPRFAEPGDKSLAPLRSLIERGRALPEYAKLRDGSVGDTLISAVGADIYINQVLAALPDEVKDAAKKQAQNQRKAAEAGQEAQDQQELGSLLSRLAGQASEAGDQQRADELQQQAEAAYEAGLNAAAKAKRAQAQADKAAEQFAEQSQKYEAQMAASMNNAAAKASDQARETSSMVKSFSLAAGGDGQHVDPEHVRDIMSLMQRQKHLQELAKMLGWARQVTRAEWRKSPRGHTTMTGYGKEPLNPARMASSEMAAMVSPVPAMRQDWLRRAADNAIIHRKYEGESQTGQGPLVMVRDESGSMAGAEHSLAVALEWALLEIARRDNRQFICIPFAGPGQYDIWRAPEQGKPDIPSLINHLSHFYGGGTEPYAPMAAALNEIADNDLKADVLVLTDGSFASPPEMFMKNLTQAKADRSLKIVTVIIGSDNREAKKFSDKVVFVGDLVGDREKLRSAIGEIV